MNSTIDAGYWTGVAGSLLALAFTASSFVSPHPLRSDSVSGGHAVPRMRRFDDRRLGLGLASLLASSLGLGVAVAARTLLTKAPPMADMWGYFVAMAFCLSLLGIAFAHRYREPTLVALVGALVMVMLLGAKLAFAARTGPLIPALQANRLLTVHVTTMMTAYGLIAIAFLASMSFLAREYQPSWRWLPSSARSHEIAYKACTIALPTLTLGVALGAYWANSAWGRYWGWDPKETMSLVTWLLLVEYMHMQGLRKWRGRRAAWVVVFGFGSIIFNMVAVNYWVVGLHSYAR